MSLLHSRRRWILSIATVLFFVGQLGIVTHTLHFDDSSRAELVCGFCATAHTSMDGPLHAPLSVTTWLPIAGPDDVRSISVAFDFPSSARARAPPAI